MKDERKMRWLGYVYMYVWICYLRPKNECISETKYLKYQQNIEGNSSFRIWKCENFLSSLAYS